MGEINELGNERLSVRAGRILMRLDFETCIVKMVDIKDVRHTNAEIGKLENVLKDEI